MTLLKPASMVLMLGLAVFGYTLPFSTVDVVRWRPNLLSAAITLGGLLSLSLANVLKEYSWSPILDKLSVFRVYAPVTVG